MSLLGRVRARLPGWAKRLLRPLYDLSQRYRSKYDSEHAYWESQFAAEGGRFENRYYRPTMLAMALEPDGAFLAGKVVADFGCGPRGSLAWAEAAQLRLGIDVLADRYIERFGPELIQHGMVYVRSTEHLIPLPSDFVDVMFTVNALDHVDDYDAMCREILRVIKPGGELIGSFNLGESPTRTEPQTLDEARIRAGLLNHLDVLSYRTTRRGPDHSLYANFLSGDLTYNPGEPGYLWVRARKPVFSTHKSRSLLGPP